MPATFKLLLLISILTGCASTSRSGIVARHCGTTKVQSTDLQQLQAEPQPGKITVVRLFATWCPYCKEDLEQISKRFQSGEWSESNVQVVLIAYNNRREDGESFRTWTKEALPGLKIPKDALNTMYSQKDAESIRALRGGDGKPLFKDWKGIPYGLVFGKDGRLVFRGHFTMSPQFQDGHYQLISELSRETCP